MAELYLQKRPISEIARAIGLTRQTVCLYISAVREQWKERHPDQYAVKLVEELARIDLISDAGVRVMASLDGRASHVQMSARARDAGVLFRMHTKEYAICFIRPPPHSAHLQTCWAQMRGEGRARWYIRGGPR